MSEDKNVSGVHQPFPRDQLRKGIQNNPDEILFENEFIYVVTNRYPIVPGHCMILPKREVTTMSDLTPWEAYAFVAAVEKTAEVLEKEYGFPCISFKHHGVYITQDHLHMHVMSTDKTYRQLYFTVKELTTQHLSSDEVSSQKVKLAPLLEK